ncbi:MAG TPA: ion transporter [Micromonospora sp.]|nr:ion transporter [Micromonospora sp.]
MPSSQLDVPAEASPGTPADTARPARFPNIPAICAAITESAPFNLLIAGLIVTNAVALGLSTYPSIDSVAGGALTVLERIFLISFVGELIVRIVAHGRRPLDFFRSGWNVFDFVVIAAALLPGLHSSSTLLRLARIARITRLVRFFPTLRAIVTGIGRSLPGVAGFLVLSVLVLYVYGMIGWLLFADDYPDDYGNIGRALLTLFVLLSLETLPDAIEAGRAVSDWTLIYFVSYVLIASYLLVNVLIGVVINSMEEARQLRMTERLRPDYDADGDGVPDEIDRIVVAQRLDELREAIISLERELRIDRDRN